jgi:hypothetical protein
MSQYLRKKRLQLGDTDVKETVDAEVEQAQEAQAPPPPEEPDRVAVECNLVRGEEKAVRGEGGRLFVRATGEAPRIVLGLKRRFDSSVREN